MSEPVDLSKFRKARQTCEPVRQAEEKYTLSGPAICPACHHAWDAESIDAPVWTFECPTCHSMRAVFKYPVSLPPQTLVYSCIKCEGQVFMMTTVGTFCIGCGGYHAF